MDAVAKQVWIKALRSGQYHQGRAALCHTDRTGVDRYCPLGVLIEETQDGEWDRGGRGLYPTVMWGYHGCFSLLPPEVRASLGILASEEKAVVGLSDYDRQSFTVIADWIEQNL